MHQNTPLNSLLPAVVKIARDAGDAILAIYQQDDLGVEQKADDSPLTLADRAAHQVICQGLEQLQLPYPLLSEEGQIPGFAERQHWQRYWLIDPLDGTKEFIKRNGEFTVNIALIDQGEPVLGVVHVPVQDTTYWAANDSGSFKQVGTTQAQAIHITTTAQQPLRVVGSRSHRGPGLDAFLANIGPHEMVSMGSSLKLCLVAEGRADIYPRLGPTSEWDTAAAHAVAAIAGAQVTDTQGTPLRYNQKDSLLNPFFVICADPALNWQAALPPQG